MKLKNCYLVAASPRLTACYSYLHFFCFVSGCEYFPRESSADNIGSRFIYSLRSFKNQTAEFEFIKKTLQERGRAHLYAIHC
jgi:hypothetical protein